MARWDRLLNALAVVLPAGAFGASVLLALAATDATAATNQNTSPQSTSEQSVAARLQAIRSGVSDMSGEASGEAQGDAKATPTWWGNGGWGRWHMGWGNGGWGNGGWHNWNNWHNGGWLNGGWGNGGWHNYWHNW
jgi:rSAM-associated Gly-rich repeat protein